MIPFTVGNSDAISVRTVSSRLSCNVRRFVPACVVEVSAVGGTAGTGCEDGFKMVACGIMRTVRLLLSLVPIGLAVAGSVLIVDDIHWRG
eukprot:scaffold67672_cov35-Attheya_sp.AAC.1